MADGVAVSGGFIVSIAWRLAMYYEPVLPGNPIFRGGGPVSQSPNTRGTAGTMGNYLADSCVSALSSESYEQRIDMSQNLIYVATEALLLRRIT
jgi:hypothetical protein